MSGLGPLDVLVVSLGSTAGLRGADDALVAAMRRAGASVDLARASPPRPMRTFALTDLAWALAARRAARAALDGRRTRAVLYSSTTAALLWPHPGAIRFDAPAAANRPGRHGVWQRPLERRRLAQARLLVPWSEAGLAEARGVARVRAVVVPVAIVPSGPPAPSRDIAAITYAANPSKKGVDRVLAAWRQVRRPGEELLLAGAELDVDEEGVRVMGVLAPEHYRTLLRRARVFVCAPRREDYGLAQLEALADGCVLASTPAPGPYVALDLARRLDPATVSGDLAAALRHALDRLPDDYQPRAQALLEPFRAGAVDRLVAETLLPRLA